MGHLPPENYDVVVVGSGPNGLAAANVAAEAGLRTLVLEASDRIGGGVRSEELTLPGFRHDVCSSVHPLAPVSPFFRSLGLGLDRLRWIFPPAAVAHPREGGEAAVLYSDIGQTAERLGPDGPRYWKFMTPLVNAWHDLEPALLGPLGFPRHPLALARFGLPAITPATRLARRTFRGEAARALFAGCAAHSVLPLSASGSSAFGLVLMMAGHRSGWPVPAGGAQSITDALAGRLRAFGGEIATGRRIASAQDLPPARAILFDTSPRVLAEVMADRLPAGYGRKLRHYPYGPGVFKVDWALREPIPWRQAGCRKAATVHVGGECDEIAAAEAAVWNGEVSPRPFVLVTQPSLFDPSRAPPGRHTAWGYCHVPNGSTADLTERIEAQVERFAPGFRDVVLARASQSPADLERRNSNLVGGDIGGGSNRLGNLFLRPTWRRYSTPNPAIFLCSAATPPGGGVHGMCGYHAARLVLKKVFRLRDDRESS